jgi:predicted nucleotidyltransferase
MKLQTLRQQLHQVLIRFPEVNLAYLFGSQVTGKTGPLSDCDIAILVSGSVDQLEIQARLEHAVHCAIKVEKIDVILLRNAPIELAHAIISTGVIIIEKNIETRVEYEARVMSLYGDYLPVLREFHTQILKGDEYEARVKRYRAALGRTERTLGSIAAVSREKSS